ncbi:MAG: tetratricopeptide repeat protein [Spirochaetales bacterium]|nr:tetratricopeptide repeat protein [Spirochaetales bacterium]
MAALIIASIIFGTFILVFIIIMIMQMLRPKKNEAILAMLKQGKSAMAIKQAKKIISKEPRNGPAHYLLGKAYLLENKPDLALIEYKTVNLIGQFDENCREVPFREQMAELYRQFDQQEEALKEYLLLIQQEPNNPAYYFKAGDLFEDRGKPDTAMGYYLKTIELNNKSTEAHLKLGMLYYKQKKNVDAKVEFEIALKCNPENNKAHFYLGRMQRDSRDFAKALSHFEKAQKDSELKIQAIIERGSCFIFMNNFERAIPELTRAINLCQDESSSEMLFARYFLAECYEKSRKIEKAIDQWEKIYAAKPSFKDVGHKLSEYQEVRVDDRMKDYLTATNMIYVKICQAVVESMNLEVRETMEIINGCQIVAVESESKWRNARKMPRLIRFYRISDIVKDATIRSLLEEMKKMNVSRGMIFTSSGFSKTALDYAESRPIDLYSKEKLKEFLYRSNFDFN